MADTDTPPGEAHEDPVIVAEAPTAVPPLDPHAPHPPDPFAYLEDGTIRNLFHVGRSLGTDYVTLGAIPPLQLDRQAGLALAVWLTVALGVEEVSEQVEKARGKA